jgi:hypothetical protein
VAEQTVTQTQTLADKQTDWIDTIDFQQFNPNQGSLQAIGVGVTGDVDGSVSIENLGPATVTSDISLLGTVSLPDQTTRPAPPIRQYLLGSRWDRMTERRISLAPPAPC